MSAFIITAKRSNGETVYLRENETQGVRMVPYAQDIAARFASRARATKTMQREKLAWRGLSNWKVEEEAM